MQDANFDMAMTIVDELVLQGVTNVCISPGSRSTPLTLAFAQRQPELNVTVHIDERSAAYFALGMAKETGKPSVLVCTSGTAVANYLPAVVEADQSDIPLIVLSADRPFELRQSGANQTVDQTILLRNQLRFFMDVAPSSENFVRSLVARATSYPGPVQINCQFRKPLEPEIIPPVRRGTEPVHIEKPQATASSAILDRVKALLLRRDGIIVVGPLPLRIDIKETVIVLSELLKYPVFADPLSGVRFLLERKNTNITAYETFLQNAEIRKLLAPKVILQIGEIPTSKHLQLLINNSNAIKIQLTERSWRDDSFTTAIAIHGSVETTLENLVNMIDRERREGQILRVCRELQALFDKHLEIFRERQKTDANLVLALMDLMPLGSNLIVSNSLPVRHVDQFGGHLGKRVHVHGNRGASGIDGIISTAAGIAQVARKTANVLVIGDLATLHDVGALLTVARYEVNLKIVILNNGGGGIFHRLPVARHAEFFEEFFLTPQKVNLGDIAGGYGIPYFKITSTDEFTKAFSSELLNTRPAVFEAMTVSGVDNSVLQNFVIQYMEDVRMKLRHLLK